VHLSQETVVGRVGVMSPEVEDRLSGLLVGEVDHLRGLGEAGRDEVHEPGGRWGGGEELEVVLDPLPGDAQEV
jgi:hypothetical protein